MISAIVIIDITTNQLSNQLENKLQNTADESYKTSRELWAHCAWVELCRLHKSLSAWETACQFLTNANVLGKDISIVLFIVLYNEHVPKVNHGVLVCYYACRIQMRIKCLNWLGNGMHSPSRWLVGLWNVFNTIKSTLLEYVISK